MNFCCPAWSHPPARVPCQHASLSASQVQVHGLGLRWRTRRLCKPRTGLRRASIPREHAALGRASTSLKFPASQRKPAFFLKLSGPQDRGLPPDAKGNPCLLNAGPAIPHKQRNGVDLSVCPHACVMSREPGRWDVSIRPPGLRLLRNARGRRCKNHARDGQCSHTEKRRGFPGGGGASRVGA